MTKFFRSAAPKTVREFFSGKLFYAPGCEKNVRAGNGTVSGYTVFYFKLGQMVLLPQNQ